MEVEMRTKERVDEGYKYIEACKNLNVEELGDFLGRKDTFLNLQILLLFVGRIRNIEAEFKTTLESGLQIRLAFMSNVVFGPSHSFEIDKGLVTIEPQESGEFFAKVFPEESEARDISDNDLRLLVALLSVDKGTIDALKCREDIKETLLGVVTLKECNDFIQNSFNKNSASLGLIKEKINSNLYETLGIKKGDGCVIC